MTRRSGSTKVAHQFPLLALACGLIQGDDISELKIQRDAAKLQEERLRRFCSQNPLAKRYLGGNLHDSALMEVRIEPNQVELIMDEFSTHCLFDVLARHIGLTTRACYKHAAPLHIKFSDVKCVELLRIGTNGAIRNCNPPTARSSMEWIADEFVSVGPRGFGLGVLFCSREGKYRLLIIEAVKMHFVERQRQAFVAAFGRRRLPVFERYWKARSHRPIDCSSVREFLDDASRDR
jgi:hypothetical protein